MNRLLKSKELAELFGLTDNARRMWRSQGQGPPYFKIGHRVRYSEARVREWLADREKVGR